MSSHTSRTGGLPWGIFTAEVEELSQRVSSAIIEQRNERVRSGTTPEPEPQRGILGFFTKAARKIRNFFRFGRKPEVTQEVTAYDAAAGIEQVLSGIGRNVTELRARMPMLSRFVFEQEKVAARISGLTKGHLALVAPEILQFLFSLSPDAPANKELMDSVERNPHELRFVVGHKKRIKRYWMPAIRHASWNLLPAIRDVLPTEGNKVRAAYGQLQDLLRYQAPDAPAEQEPVAEPVSKEPKKGLRARLKSLFRRRRTQS